MTMKLPVLSLEDLTTESLERAQTIPAAWYTDPTYHELEKVSVFRQSWHNVGHVDHVSRPGDYLVATAADQPIIVVRDAEGGLRAFYNVCRHRAGPLATKDGNANVLKCLYHGWTYKLDGSLRGVPRWDRVELFDKRNFGLIPVRLDTWHGLLFVNLSDTAPPLAWMFEGLLERVAPNSLDSKRFYRRVDYDVQCNWKVYIDNYVEGYHVPHVHPELFKLFDFRRYRTDVFDMYSIQQSPFSEGDNIYGGEGGTGFYCFVFPNFMLNIAPGRLQTNVVVPHGHDRTRVVFQYFYDDITSPASIDRIERDIEFSDRVQLEDGTICEAVQRGLSSFVYDRGRFSVECEGAVHHFHTLLKQAYRSWVESNHP